MTTPLTRGAHHIGHAVLVAAGTEIEFAPELVGKGPAKHLMCYEPSGVRLEFIWLGQ